MNTYQGGIPYAYSMRSRGTQRGAGFFSSAKKFLLPIGKAILPQVFGGVADVLLKKQPMGEVLQKRGLKAGKRAFGAVVRTMGADDEDEPAVVPAKKYKRKVAPAKKPQKKKKRRFLF